MPIITKEVEIKINPNNAEYYKSLGYKIPMRKSSKSIWYKTKREFVYDIGKEILVKTEDLPNDSNIKVYVRCDICGEEKNILYQQYTKSLKKYGYYTCRYCNYKKASETMKILYGTDYYTQTDECKERVKNTCNLKYGKDYPSQSLEVREKITKSFYQNGSQKVSKQQKYICDLYHGILNFPIKHYNIDIYLEKDNLAVEYDGGGHSLNVIIGKETTEEYNQKEIIRNNVIKSEGYKQMRIISVKDLLPSNQILLQMLSEAKQYFSQYPNHSWIEFNIDTSTVRNAEQKDGVYFDYGELRKIKNSDLSEQIA